MPEAGLQSGDLDAIVAMINPEHHEVEFVAASGRTLPQAAVRNPHLNVTAADTWLTPLKESEHHQIKSHAVMHRRIAGSLAAALLLPQIAWAQGGGSADLILRAGEIVTINEHQPQAEAVAIRNGVILAVGDDRAVMKLKGSNTRVIDLRGKTLVPGFIDAHGHVFNAGVQALAANLLAAPDGNVKDIASLKAQLNTWHNGKTSQKFGWIIGFGYDDAQLAEQRHPNRDDLDAVSRDVPVLAIHQSATWQL